MEICREVAEKVKDSVSSLQELQDKIVGVDLPINAIINQGDRLLFASIEYTNKPENNYCLCIKEDLEYELWVRGNKIKKKSIATDDIPSLPPQLMSIEVLKKILTFLKTMSSNENPPPSPDAIVEAIETLEQSDCCTDNKISFIIEQLSLSVSKPTARRYSPSLLAFSIMIQKTSPAAYAQLLHENILTLPSVRRLRQLTSALDSEMKLGETAINYLKARLSKLSSRDGVVSLIIDEVYTQKKVEYVNGKFYGVENGHLTKTNLCLMIRSVGGSYRDVIAMFPVSNLNAKLQQDLWFRNINILETLGFDVVVTLTDGNEINSKFYKEIIVSKTLKDSIKNPFNDSRLIFLGFDSVHIFKCFYNNFVTRKLFVLPKFDQFNLLLVARFADLKLLYYIELGKPLRKAYKLSDKILSPTNIEKTNVMLADGLFHESTINALRYYGKKECYQSFLQTAELLWIFRQWFNVLNVKSRYDGQRTRDSGREAVNLENRNEVLGYLNSFSMWLQEWESLDTQGLSKQTFSTAKQTTNMLQGLINYLLDEKKFSYVLLRHIQSDAIERRFGWYRQLSGGNYFNSVLQFIQAEKTIRIRSLVQMGFNFSEVKEIFDSSVTERQNCLSTFLKIGVTLASFH